MVTTWWHAHHVGVLIHSLWLLVVVAIVVHVLVLLLVLLLLLFLFFIASIGGAAAVSITITSTLLNLYHLFFAAATEDAWKATAKEEAETASTTAC